MNSGTVIAMRSNSNWKKKTIWTVVFLLWCVFFAYFSDYNWPTGTGNLCMILFITANIYVPAKKLRKRYRWRKVQPYFDWLLKYHCYLNTVAFITACIHCYTTSWANFWLWLSLALMGVLTLNGFVMKFKYPPRLRKGVYVLHTQQIIFIVLLYSSLKGHYVFTWLPP